MRPLGLRVRAGLHAGECELLPGEDVGGIAVHIAARIAALAEADEVLASGTVRDLSVGSPFMLESRGEQQLKGVAEPWRVYSVAGKARPDPRAPQPARSSAVSALPLRHAREGRTRWGAQCTEQSAPVGP